VGEALKGMLSELGKSDAKALRDGRRRKYLDLGSKGLAA